MHRGDAHERFMAWTDCAHRSVRLSDAKGDEVSWDARWRASDCVNKPLEFASGLQLLDASSRNRPRLEKVLSLTLDDVAEIFDCPEPWDLACGHQARGDAPQIMRVNASNEKYSRRPIVAVRRASPNAFRWTGPRRPHAD